MIQAMEYTINIQTIQTHKKIEKKRRRRKENKEIRKTKNAEISFFFTKYKIQNNVKYHIS